MTSKSIIPFPRLSLMLKLRPFSLTLRDGGFKPLTRNLGDLGISHRLTCPYTSHQKESLRGNIEKLWKWDQLYLLMLQFHTGIIVLPHQII